MGPLACGFFFFFGKAGPANFFPLPYDFLSLAHFILDDSISYR